MKLVYDLKNIKWYLLGTFVVGYLVLLPVCTFNLSNFPPEASIAAVLSQSQMILPIMAAFPLIFLLRPYIENDGNEVLYTFKAVRKRGFLSPVLYAVMYVVIMLPFFIWIYFCTYGPLWYELFRSMVQVLFFLFLAYFLIYLFKSTLGAFVSTAVVYLVMIFAANPDSPLDSILRKVGLFAIVTMENPRPFEPEKYLIYFCISILLFIGGVILNRRYFH